MSEEEKIKNILHLVLYAVDMTGSMVGRGMAEELTPTLEEFLRRYTKDEKIIKSLLKTLQKDDEKELEQLFMEQIKNE